MVHASTTPDRPSALLLPTILLAVFVMPISIAGTAIAIPEISADLGTSPAGLQWVVNGFNFSVTLFTVAWGAIAGRVGYRRTFIVGVVVMLAGSLLSVAANSLGLLDVARVIAGIGAAAIVTGGSALLSHAYSGAQRTHAFALLGTTVGLGLAAGPAISGGLVSATGWRGTFAVVGAIAALVLVVACSGAVPRDHATTQATGGKLIDFSPLRSRAFRAIVLVPVAGSIGYVSILTYLPLALSAVQGVDAAAAGVLMVPLTLPVLIAPLLATTLIRRAAWATSPRIIAASLLFLVVGDLLLLLLSPTLPLWLLIAPMVLLGFGWGLPVGLIDGEALATVPKESAGAAAGVLNFLRLGSEAVAVAGYAAVISVLLTSLTGDSGLARSAAAGADVAPAGYTDAFRIMLVVLAAATAALSVVILRGQRAARTAARSEPHAHTDAPTRAPVAPDAHVPADAGMRE